MKKNYQELVVKIFAIDEVFCTASLESLDDKHLIEDQFREVWGDA